MSEIMEQLLVFISMLAHIMAVWVYWNKGEWHFWAFVSLFAVGGAGALT